jgi:diaminopimelate epimerase
MLEWRGSEPGSPQNPIFMTGPAETVFSGEIEWQQ